MEKSEAKQLVEKLLQKTYLNTYLPSLDWKFGGFDKSTKHSGLCKIKAKQIKLSEKFLKYQTKEEVQNTILHEIAHALDVEKRGTTDHSSKWKNIARAIGCNPSQHLNIRNIAEKAGDAVFMEYKYVLRCEDHGIIGTFMRRPKRKYVCATCKKPANITQNY